MWTNSPCEVLAPGLAVSHPVPGTVGDLARMFFRNGRGSAYIQRHHPELIFDTLETLEFRDRIRIPFALRVVRFPVRWIRHLIVGRLFRFLGDPVYLAGYLYFLLALANRSRKN